MSESVATRRYVLRVWLPDHPGALGRVAGAIGSVGASLIGIDILEQGGGWAIDELIVDAVGSPNASEKLIAALTLIEGVSVEDIRDAPDAVVDPRLDALESASDLVAQAKTQGLRETLVERALHDMAAEWCALVELDTTDESMVTFGETPNAPWLRAFVEGSRMSEQLSGAPSGSEDTAWAELTDARCALVIGRQGRPFRSRERAQLDVLARIADRLLALLPD